MEIRTTQVDLGDVLRNREDFINRILHMFQQEAQLKPLPPIDAIAVACCIPAAIIHNNTELNADIFHQIFNILLQNKHLFQKPIIVQPVSGIVKP